ncbi:hypothetical protein CUMW_026810 [Citrus unshiu]|nr:hypothetical protein CUMW_026810 [Citrus unshiu]
MKIPHIMIQKVGLCGEDPNPDDDPNEKFYAGDNRYRMGGQALEWKQVNIHAWKASGRGQDIHPEAALTQAELHYRWEKNIEEKKRLLKTEEDMPMELLFGESDSILNRDLAERILRAAN